MRLIRWLRLTWFWKTTKTKFKFCWIIQVTVNENKYQDRFHPCSTEPRDRTIRIKWNKLNETEVKNSIQFQHYISNQIQSNQFKLLRIILYRKGKPKLNSLYSNLKQTVVAQWWEDYRDEKYPLWLLFKTPLFPRMRLSVAATIPSNSILLYILSSATNNNKTESTEISFMTSNKMPISIGYRELRQDQLECWHWLCGICSNDLERLW